MTDRFPQIRITAMPTDLNPYRGVFGGWLMAQMALGAGSLALPNELIREILGYWRATRIHVS